MKINQKSIETLMVLSSEMISNAKMGDTAETLSSATFMFALFKDHYNFFGGENYINRDRFVLADSSLSALYYSAMNMFGFDIAGIDLRNYCCLGSKTPFSPNPKITEGVDLYSGSSGEGISGAVGLALASVALAEKFNAQKFNIINNYTFCLCNDISLMNGMAQEAISLAGTLKISRLILLCNQTRTTKDGILEETCRDNLKKKFKAMGWNVIVTNGQSYTWSSLAIARAKRSSKPTLIIFKTKAGYQSLYEGNSVLHTRVLNQFEVEKMKADYSLNGSFNVSNDVKQFCMRTRRRLKVEYQKWERQVVLFQNTHPELAQQLNAFYEKPKISFYKSLKGKMEQADNLLEANQMILNHISMIRPCIMGGSFDLANITKSHIIDSLFLRENYRGKDIAFGGRKIAIGNICNGISSYFNSPCYVSGLLGLAQNLLSSIRISAISKLPIQYIFTHDSILSEKLGLTYTPVEQLAQLRNIPNLTIFRPADCMELLACHSYAYESEEPNAIILSTKQLPLLLKTNYEQVKKGAYVYECDNNPSCVIYASGSELHLAIELKDLLNKSGFAVMLVSVPSFELFNKQPEKYKESILMPSIKNRFAIEFSNDNSWRYFIGDYGMFFGIKDFIPCGTSEDLTKLNGLTTKDIFKLIKNKISENKSLN